MKKFILPGIFLFISSLFLVFFPSQSNAQTKGPLSCQELKDILDSKECPHWALDPESLSLWCGQRKEDLYEGEIGSVIPVYKNRPPDHTLLSGDLSCLDKKGSPQPSAQPQSKQTAQPVKQSKPSGINVFNLFGSNPFATWFNLRSLAELGTFIKSGGAEQFTEEVILHAVGQEPAWEKDTREGNEFLKFFSKVGLVKDATLPSARQLRGRQPFFSPTAKDWGFLPEYKFPEDSKTDSFSAVGQDKNLQYKWGGDAGAVIHISKGSEGSFIRPTQDLKRVIKLDKGELEIKVKNANSKEKFGVQTDFLDIVVIGTHFWVKNDPDRKLALVGVYEGKVEVKTKDGQTTTVSPNGDKPGVVAVAQKLSVAKLAVAGLVLAVIIGLIHLKFFMKSITAKKVKNEKIYQP